MLNHVRVSLTQYMRNRLTSIQALTELLRDNPKIAAETAVRLLENIDALLDSLDGLVDTNVVYDGLDAPRIKLRDSAEIISTWGDAEHRVQARVHVLETDPLIPTEYLERIIMPLIAMGISLVLVAFVPLLFYA